MVEALSQRDSPGNPELWDVRSMNRTNVLSKWPQPGSLEGLVQGGWRSEQHPAAVQGSLSDGYWLRKDILS